MALDPTILSVRRYDLLDMADGYTGEPEDEYEAADLTADKDDLKDDWAALIQTIQTANNAETDPAVWCELVNKLSTTHHTAETVNEYLSAKKVRQDEIKDIGGFDQDNGFINDVIRHRHWQPLPSPDRDIIVIQKVE